jgi:hypothetical protein
MTSEIVISYHPADGPLTRRDVNRLLDDTNLTTNTLGDAVLQNGLIPYDLCGGEIPEPRHCLVDVQPVSRQPHTTPSARAPDRRGLSQLRMGWNDGTATYENDLPDGSRNVSGFRAVQFRASVNFTDPRNLPGSPQDFVVTMTDGAGASASTPVSSWSGALFYPPGGPTVTPLPKVILNTVRIPLNAFVGVDLTDVRSVTFKFSQPVQGALLISDLAFADAQGAAPEPGATVTQPDDRQTKP